MGKWVERYWEVFWTLLALAIEALLILYIDRSLSGWLLAASVTFAAWAVALTANVEINPWPRWLALALGVHLLLLGVVVATAHDAASMEAGDPFRFLPMGLGLVMLISSVAITRSAKGGHRA